MILQGDALTQLKTLPDESINCVVTSPPYYGLRNYGKPGQLGLEKTPQEYVVKLVEIFREIKRVLRHDGTVFLNLGDSYASSGTYESVDNRNKYRTNKLTGGDLPSAGRAPSGNLPQKNLIGIPWRVAFALQDDGWILRSDIIWHKPNSMPESVTDRPTKSHEYIFLLVKSARYWYDQDAVREENTGDGRKTGDRKNFYQVKNGYLQGKHKGFLRDYRFSGRNKRTVWTVATQPYSGAHFAVFPPKLIEPCVLAGCPARVCVECETPWIREVEKEKVDGGSKWQPNNGNRAALGDVSKTSVFETGLKTITKTLGFIPQCDCNAPHKPGVVLDPFFGSGTTGQVAISTKRDYIGIELNDDYIELAKERLRKTQPVLPGIF